MDKQLTQPAGTDLTARGTGRTTRDIAAALLAAAAGHRVIYVTQGPARVAAATALQMLNDMLVLLSTPGSNIQTEAYAITFYHDGRMLGEVRFCNMNDNPGKRNYGLSGSQLYRLVDDHAVTELRAAQALELEKVAAMEQIALLMEKHGWECASAGGPTTDVTHFYRAGCRTAGETPDVRTVKPEA